MNFTWLKKINDVVMAIFKWVVIVFAIVMTCMTFFNVVLRYVVGTTIAWSEELCRFLFIWTTFLGVVVANDKEEHMHLDFIVNLFPYKVRKVILGVVYLAVVVFLAILARGALRYTIIQLDWTSSALHVPYGAVYSISLVSFTVLAVQFFCRAIRQFMEIGHPEDAAVKEA
ncbi:MAG: TRAP transporter small permease [Lachnospiraceae bacterium]|nr:TRAP transporter small permease [Lachnospiraceae bacterium]